MHPVDFQRKWIGVTLKERSAAQEHFLDLCRVLGAPTPAEADPTGVGGDGWADVWYDGHFGWEYKGKHANLDAAYLQLLRYKDDLNNPPLLIVCDLNRILIHTNFTGTVKTIHEIDLATFADAESQRGLRLRLGGRRPGDGAGRRHPVPAAGAEPGAGGMRARAPNVMGGRGTRPSTDRAGARTRRARRKIGEAAAGAHPG